MILQNMTTPFHDRLGLFTTIADAEDFDYLVCDLPTYSFSYYDHSLDTGFKQTSVFSPHEICIEDDSDISIHDTASVRIFGFRLGRIKKNPVARRTGPSFQSAKYRFFKILQNVHRRVLRPMGYNCDPKGPEDQKYVFQSLQTPLLVH